MKVEHNEICGNLNTDKDSARFYPDGDKFGPHYLMIREPIVTILDDRIVVKGLIFFSKKDTSNGDRLYRHVTETFYPAIIAAVA